MRNDSRKECPFGDEIVSYMYDEMSIAERPKFEEHLVACQVCTDDFAAVSVARFETYDWKRGEFDPLSTPRIVIPYEERAISLGQRWSAWIGSVTAVPLAAALIMGLSYFFLSGRSGDNMPTLATAVVDQAPQMNSEPTAVGSPRVETPSGVKGRMTSEPVVRQASFKRKATVPKTLVARQVSPGIKLANDLAVNVSTQNRPAPRLGLNDEEDDVSLRLSDLFDQSRPPRQR